MAQKKFMKAFKVFIKPFEAPQGSVKIKIQVNFFSLSGIGAERVKQPSCLTWRLNFRSKLKKLRGTFT